MREKDAEKSYQLSVIRGKEEGIVINDWGVGAVKMSISQ